jgi:hypothetical protein
LAAWPSVWAQMLLRKVCLWLCLLTVVMPGQCTAHCEEGFLSIP